jgi:hypothetical protein
VKADDLEPELAELTEALAHAPAALPPLAPHPALRGRLLETLGGPDRFRAFFGELARRFDLTVEAVRGLLAKVDDPGAWEPTPMSWIQLIHFPGGPALGEADAGFVKVSAGTTFPRHSHDGPEMAFVLEGRMIKNGRSYLPGDVDEVPTEEVHEYHVGSESDLVVMVCHHGIKLLRP